MNKTSKIVLFFGGILVIGVVLAANMGGEEVKNPCEQLKQLEPVSSKPTRYEILEAERRNIRPIDVRAENLGFKSANELWDCKEEIIK